MRIKPFRDYLPKIQRFFLVTLAAAHAGFAADPRSMSTTPRGGGVGITSGVRPTAPSNGGFTGQFTSIVPAPNPSGLPARLQIRTEFGYTREVICDGGTRITRAGLPALLKEAKIGDTVGVVFFSATERAVNLAFTPRAVQVRETPAQIAKKKTDAAAKTLKHYQDLADNGDPYGQYRMGLIYLKGEGVTNDVALGRSLLEKSAAQGNDEAKAELVKLAHLSSSSATSSATQTNAAASAKRE